MSGATAFSATDPPGTDPGADDPGRAGPGGAGSARAWLPWAATLARLVLAAVLGVAGALKIGDPAGATLLRDFGLALLAAYLAWRPTSALSIDGPPAAPAQESDDLAGPTASGTTAPKQRS